jgi:hypothetical protein
VQSTEGIVIELAAVEDNRLLIDGLRAWAGTLPDIRLAAVHPTVDGLLRAVSADYDVVLLNPVLRAEPDPALNVCRLIEAGHRVLVITTSSLLMPQMSSGPSALTWRAGTAPETTDHAVPFQCRTERPANAQAFVGKGERPGKGAGHRRCDHRPAGRAGRRDGQPQQRSRDPGQRAPSQDARHEDPLLGV